MLTGFFLLQNTPILTAVVDPKRTTIAIYTQLPGDGLEWLFKVKTKYSGTQIQQMRQEAMLQGGTIEVIHLGEVSTGEKLGGGGAAFLHNNKHTSVLEN